MFYEEISKVSKELSIEPIAKQKEYEERISKVTEFAKQQELERVNIQKQFENFKTEILVENEVLSAIPDNLINGLSKKDVMTLFKANSGYEIASENGNILVKKGGEVVKNNLQNPIPLKDVVNSYVTERNFVATPSGGGGRGAGNQEPNNGQKFNSITELYKHFEKNGIDPMSKEGEAMQLEFEKNKTN